MKTLYISDLDGTLLNGSAELSEYTKITLNKMIAKGLNFSIATARRLDETLKILAGLTLNTPIVLQNGVLIHDITQQRYTQVNIIVPKAADDVINTLRAFEVTSFVWEYKDGKFSTYHESREREPLSEFTRKRISKYYESFRHTGNFSGTSLNHIIYASVVETHERIAPLYDALTDIKGIDMTIYKDNYSDLWYLEIFSDTASKQNGVMYLREVCGFDRVIGFGDNLNDLPMFAACDVRVAVENAKLEVKAAADYICDTNDNDGVVKWIEEGVEI